MLQLGARNEAIQQNCLIELAVVFFNVESFDVSEEPSVLRLCLTIG